MQKQHKNEKRELKNNKEYTNDCLDQALQNIEYIEQQSKKKKKEMQQLDNKLDDAELELEQKK